MTPSRPTSFLRVGRTALAALLAAVALISFNTPVEAMVGSDDELASTAPAAVVALYTPGAPRGEQFCSGTLIAPRWVITAGHCLDDLTSPTQLVVAVRGARQRYTVVRYYLHPRWDVDTYDLGYDIALLQLASPVKNVAAVPYRTTPWSIEETAAVQLEAYGWGINDETESPLQVGATRQMLWNDPVPSSLVFRPRLQIAAVAFRMIPATSDGALDIAPSAISMQFEGVCSGDSGGPLLERRSDGFATLVGVVSYGNADCYDRSPGIYTKVSAHARWISQVIRKAGVNRR